MFQTIKPPNGVWVYLRKTFQRWSHIIWSRIYNYAFEFLFIWKETGQSYFLDLFSYSEECRVGRRYNFRSKSSSSFFYFFILDRQIYNYFTIFLSPMACDFINNHVPFICLVFVIISVKFIKCYINNHISSLWYYNLIHIFCVLSLSFFLNLYLNRFRVFIGTCGMV